MSGIVVLVTGALSGVGRATALAFAQIGARLVVSGRRDEAGKLLVEQLRSMGAEAEYLRVDVRQEWDVKSLIEFTLERFGRVDVAVNGAGVEGSHRLLLDESQDNYVNVFETNVLGTLLCAKHELAAMHDQGHGNIVNLSSTMGHAATAGMSIYVASQYAIEGLTKTAALEAAVFGVRVNAIALGAAGAGAPARLAMGPSDEGALVSPAPLRRFVSPEAAAEAILFVASDKASSITGQVLCIDGGNQ